MNNYRQEWSGWLPLDAKIKHERFAVYKIRLVTEDSKPFTLPRLFKKDMSGIMCIGQTTNMERRRNQAYGAISKGDGHSAMNLVFYLREFCNFDKRFANWNFQFNFSKCKSGHDAKKREDDLSKEYFREFGEVPPLNSVLPNRYDNW